MWNHYLQPTALDEALTQYAARSGAVRLVAGGTDLVVELSHGLTPVETVIDLTRIEELRGIRVADNLIELGALVTHNDVLASAACRTAALPLVQACAQVGAPQLRTRATVAGNLVTASPANDTISALVALDANLVLTSVRGERTVPLSAFYRGVRRTVLAPDELVRAIRVPRMTPNQRGVYVKLGSRRAQAISIVHLAIVLTLDEARIGAARIALGSVAPVITRATGAEAFLIGQPLTPDVVAEAGRLAAGAVSPITDVRGSAGYRSRMVTTLVARALTELAAGVSGALPATFVLLETGHGLRPSARSTVAPFTGVIETTIDGQPQRLEHSTSRTLLQALRDDAMLTGSKEGCAEGECGACTVWLDGQAVMSCLVPAAQAHGGEVTTIAGLGASGGSDRPDALHPLQQAFIDHGSVQCGFCIPGMLMAGAKLLEEHPAPDLPAIQTGLSGNICRCTGYRKIFDAVLAASGQPVR